jgi:hypothetical protein
MRATPELVAMIVAIDGSASALGAVSCGYSADLLVVGSGADVRSPPLIDYLTHDKEATSVK